MLDILVLNYNDSATTISFTNSVKDFSNVAHVLIVDNKSTDDSLEKLKKITFGKVSLIESKSNGGYGAGNNLGIRFLAENFKSEYILLSNPDVIVQEDVLAQLEFFLRNNPDYAIVSSFMCKPNGTRQINTAFRIPSKWEYILSIDLVFRRFIHSFNYKMKEYENMCVKDVGSVSGSMFLMRTDDMLKYGMFDESIFLYCEEVVLGKKMSRSGKKIGLLPNLSYIHNHSVSISKKYTSVFSRQKILSKSKLYVLKCYFSATCFDLIIANILAKLVLVELFFVALYRKMR